MPPGGDPTQEKSLQEVVDEVDQYPIEAFVFLQQGLGFAVNHVHGEIKEDEFSERELNDHAGEMADVPPCRHITGQQLCEGLRAYALNQWGLLAGVVLARWRINSTFDFGRIVFALIAAGHMQKTDTDTIEDFRGVYDFKTAFDGSYQIGHPR
jgi:uncharacterized repeat protein (TIGR04138 family)